MQTKLQFVNYDIYISTFVHQHMQALGNNEYVYSAQRQTQINKLTAYKYKREKVKKKKKHTNVQ